MNGAANGITAAVADRVMEAIAKAGLVEVEVSARHVHLSQKDWEAIFGTEKSDLTPKRPLSQPGQYLSEERVSLITPKGRMDRVAVLGPFRGQTQVELSKSDCIALGIDAPIRESGHIDGSGRITIEGPRGAVTIPQGVIIAKRHVHVPETTARHLGFKNGEIVSVQLFTDRPVILQDVVLRVSDKFSYRMHIDFDEANAADVRGFTLGQILKQEPVK
ncbi:phosphate propanoyltransferase [Cloacibacillus porcorum]|uniref:phosphate propanoyltransferase n=1 Tax=Cloacibacillus porcorum TaxID=1197717 RepID=UPI001459782B|nr:phosphate propanoyltransferase [Cloacibacillus porcorum]MCC8185577.1 phosphate propanoyltransferase [Cloacibacillus porcorum]MDY5389681.1 phosphate propanoyltransferase [Cloacibacillus porcorum]NMF17433.1 phosphate propanoyltransferase [Cloacibacillus porcorum]